MLARVAQYEARTGKYSIKRSDVFPLLRDIINKLREATGQELDPLLEEAFSTMDKYLESATIDANGLVTFTLANEGDPVDLQLGTMALKKFWTGTQAAYDLIDPKDANTIYHVEEE